MKPFVIYTYDYIEHSGGVKVMHKLCDLLNKNGYKSYLTPINHINEMIVSNKYITPIASKELLNNNDYIVVYPEGIMHNPLDCKNVVRWILGPALQCNSDTYSKSDLVYWYMDYYYKENLGQKNNKLYIVESHSDIFNNRGQLRSGSCYTFRKANPTSIVHPIDSTFISYEESGELSGLANLFNRTERFYCYDTYTFLYVQAAMCGCLSIVIPDSNISKKQWLMGAELQRYGIAYGEDDIPRALKTLPLLYKNIKKIEKNMNNSVINFAEHCLKYFK